MGGSWTLIADMLLASDGGAEGPLIWVPFPAESLVDLVGLGTTNTLSVAMVAVSLYSLGKWGVEGCASETVCS